MSAATLVRWNGNATARSATNRMTTTPEMIRPARESTFDTRVDFRIRQGFFREDNSIPYPLPHGEAGASECRCGVGSMPVSFPPFLPGHSP